MLALLRLNRRGMRAEAKVSVGRTQKGQPTGGEHRHSRRERQGGCRANGFAKKSDLRHRFAPGSPFEPRLPPLFPNSAGAATAVSRRVNLAVFRISDVNKS